MKSKLSIASLTGVISLLIGMILGARITNKYGEAAVSLQRADQLDIDLKTADLLHNGDTNSALSSLVGQIDYDIVMLAARPKGMMSETNTIAALCFATTYRKTNLWMEAFEPTNSQISGMTPGCSSIDREKEAKAVWFYPSSDLSKKIRAAQTLIPKGATPGDVLRILGKSSPWGQSDWDIFLLAYCPNANGAIVVVFNKITPGNDEDFTNFCFSCVSYAMKLTGNTLIPPDTNGR